mmetsp:Transcript_112763/g.313792  ORF Transcript_112763/g.313792 Transcript_112763/m.313792 type:complete len:683 (+) Transcript_112763:64-2112(+)
MQHSSSAASVGLAATASPGGLGRSSSSPSIANKDVNPIEPTSPPNGLVALRFKPGGHGLSWEGTRVTGSCLQAWMRGVRPGWNIHKVADQVVQDGEEIGERLQQADSGEKRYEIHFQRGQKKRLTEAAEEAMEAMERKKNTQLVRKTFSHKGGIEKPEHRGITCRQLDQILAFARENCFRWKDTQPARFSPYAGKTLQMDFFNFYHADCWILQPGTEVRKCAFVELMTNARQTPQWFVTHTWGEPIVDVRECLRAHADVRGLSIDTPYWIPAFCMQQCSLKEELREGIAQTSMFKGLQGAKFQTLFILDGDATAFTRIWCLFETSLCLDEGGALLDFALCHAGVGEVLVQGLTEAEEELELREPGAGVRAKRAREASFPVEIAELGMEVAVQQAKAIPKEDVPLLLSCIAGLDLDEAPPAAHDRYTETNRQLHAFFGCALYAAIRASASRSARSQRASKALQALRGDRRKALDLCLEGLDGDGVRQLAQSLPPGLEDLKMRLKGSSVRDQDLCVLGEHLQGDLHSVSLDLVQCAGISDAGVAGFERHMENRKTIVDLKLAGTQVSKAKQDWYIAEALKRGEGGEEQKQKEVSQALGMAVCQDPAIVRQFEHKVVPAVPELVRALERGEPRARRSAAKALGTLGSKAAEAAPALQKAVQEDTEEVVKKAAAAALAKVCAKGNS